MLTPGPTDASAKLDDLELLFLNMHNLINAFRPHQARESILQMLRAEIEARREAAREIRQTIDASRRTVEQAHADMLGAVEDAPPLASAASSPLPDDAGDVKMEDAESAADSASVSEASEVAALTPAQLEQAEARPAHWPCRLHGGVLADMVACWWTCRRPRRRSACRRRSSRRLRRPWAERAADGREQQAGSRIAVIYGAGAPRVGLGHASSASPCIVDTSSEPSALATRQQRSANSWGAKDRHSKGDVTPSPSLGPSCLLRALPTCSISSKEPSTSAKHDQRAFQARE